MKKKLLFLFTVLNLSVWSQSSDNAALYSLRYNSRDNTYDSSLLKYSVPSYDFTSEQKFSNPRSIRITDKDENVSRKSPWLAFGLSMLYPGLGQLYNAEYGKGLLMGGLGTVGLGLAMLAAMSTNFDSESNPDYIGVMLYSGVAIYGGVYLWSMIDAPISASNINEQRRASGFSILLFDDGKYAMNIKPSHNYSCQALVFSMSF